MTKPDLEAIRSRLQKATPGEWSDREFVRDAKIHSLLPEDADFIVNAHNTDIPALLSYVAELERTLVEAAIPLEALVLSGAVDHVSLLGRREINNAVMKIRAVLADSSTGYHP